MVMLLPDYSPPQSRSQLVDGFHSVAIASLGHHGPTWRSLDLILTKPASSPQAFLITWTLLDLAAISRTVLLALLRYCGMGSAD